MLWPHLPQKREPAARLFAHRGHGNDASGISAALTITNLPPPQRPQNPTPSANLVPQLPHATIHGITLDGGEPPVLAPCDDEGWLDVP